MSWQPYESQGIAVINSALVEKLSRNLESKELQLCRQIIDSIHSFQEVPPSLAPSETSVLRLHEAVEEFGKKVHLLASVSNKVLPQDEWKSVAGKIQEAVRHYIEILKSCSEELFHQLGQIGFEHWEIELAQSVAMIKDLLIHRMDDLIWAVRRLKQQLKEFRHICESKADRRALLRFLNLMRRPILDPSMEAAVAKCKKKLKFHYQKFMKKYRSYQQLHAKAEQSLEKFTSYRALTSLDLDVQDRIKKIYRLLKLWDCNFGSKALPEEDIIKAIKSVFSPEGTVALFRDYYSAVRKGLFDKSRMIKKKFRAVFYDVQARQPIIDNVLSYHHELNALTAMCTKYQKFILSKDPNSYVRSRLGFSERIVGKEPKAIKQLETLIVDIEHLNALCQRFQSAMESELALDRELTPQMEAQIHSHLHDMGQPLVSKAIMKSHAKHILDHLQYLDELTSFHPEVVGYVCRVLGKTMRASWKYHVVQEIPLFEQLYTIHRAIVGPLEDRQHANRLGKFKFILGQLEQWIEKKETLQHAHGVDLDIHDIKAYLQDFFAGVQGLKSFKEPVNIEDITKSLDKSYEAVLEYRHLFSEFFHRLRADVPEEHLMRRQLLFVDQYFEAIENRLEETSKAMLGGQPPL